MGESDAVSSFLDIVKTSSVVNANPNMSVNVPSGFDIDLLRKTSVPTLDSDTNRDVSLKDPSAVPSCQNVYVKDPLSLRIILSFASANACGNQNPSVSTAIKPMDRYFHFFSEKWLTAIVPYLGCFIKL